MVDALAALSTIIDHSSIPTVSKTLLSCHLRCNNHQVAKKSYMAVLSLGYASQSVTVFRDDKEVFGGYGGDIAEGKAFVVLIDHISWDLSSNYLIKDGIFNGSGYLGQLLFVLFCHTVRASKISFTYFNYYNIKS